MIPESALASMASSLSMFVANLVLAEISEHRAVKGDVNRLKKNYERVALMMASAERRVALDDQAATYWLKRVTDHMYQVQIVVDQWVIKNEKMHREVCMIAGRCSNALYTTRSRAVCGSDFICPPNGRFVF